MLAKLTFFCASIFFYNAFLTTALPLALEIASAGHAVQSRTPTRPTLSATTGQPGVIPTAHSSAAKSGPTRLITRTESPGGLFGENNIPDLADIDQTTILDCGLISVLGALVSQNRAWIDSIIAFSGDAVTTKEATFRLYQPSTLTLNYQTVTKISLSNVRSDALEGWWVGGIEQAIRQSGHEVALISPLDALEILTGRRATYYYTANDQTPQLGSLSKDVVWEFLKANADQNPIILQSQVGALSLQSNHAFWVRAVENDSGTRWLHLWNPYGRDEVYDFDAVWRDCYALYSFAPPAA